MSDDDTRLMEFALGLLEGAEREAVERELQGSEDARREMAALEAVLGNVALAVQPLAPDPGLRERLRASLAPDPRFAAFKDRLAALFDLSTEGVGWMLDALGAVSEEPWEDAGMAGVRLLHLDGGPKVAAADCGLVHVEPGRAFPPHRHLGDEWVLVLQGQAQEDSGRQFLPGDLIHKAPGTAHSFRILGEEPFVFAVVLFGGLAWGKA